MSCPAQQTYNLPTLLGELDVLARVVQVASVVGSHIGHDLLHSIHRGIRWGRGELGRVDEQGLVGVAGDGTEVSHEVLEAGWAPGQQLLGQLHLRLEGLDLGGVTAHGSSVGGLVDVPGAVGLDKLKEAIAASLCRNHRRPVVEAVQGSPVMLGIGSTLALPDTQVGTVVGYWLP